MSHGPRMLGAALWLGAWLGSRASADDTIDALGRLHADAPAAPLIGRVRATGADRLWLLLPRPGRTLGWPRDVPEAPEPALLLCCGDSPVGLVRAAPAGWRVDAAAACTLAPLMAGALPSRAAARAFAAAVAGAADQLERLDLARRADRDVPDRWQAVVADLPPGLDPAAVTVLARAATVLDALDLALGSEGAAVTAGEVRARAAALVEVRNAVEDVVSGLVGDLVGGAGTVAV